MTDDYRAKAAKCRRLAASIPGDPAAAKLLEMAEQFETLAREAENAALGYVFREQTHQQPHRQAQQQQQPQPDDETDPK